MLTDIQTRLLKYSNFKPFDDCAFGVIFGFYIFSNLILFVISAEFKKRSAIIKNSANQFLI
jgi:hypothetical protein